MPTAVSVASMRVEFAMATSGPGDASIAVLERRRRIDGFELALFAAFAAVSVWVLALDLWQVVAHGRVWTGTDGLFVIDQMQYLAWIRDASHHVLASNLFVLRPTPADYFQPAVAISGVVSALGVPAWLALLMWKPVAVVGIFFTVRACVYRSLAGQLERRAGVTLALFFGSFTIVYGAFGIVGDLFPVFLSWGYPFGLMALAAMLVALLAYDRDRAAGRIGWTPAVAGALASSLHPWQGELLILVVIGAELWRWRELKAAPRRLALPAATVIGTAVPLVYYLVLGKADISWGLAREAGNHTFSFLSIALALAPLAVVALLGYRGPPRSFFATVTRTWPIAALVVYALSATGISATPLHAFEGITVPLAILAVQGVQRAGWRRVPRRRLIGALVIAAATVPATAYGLSIAQDFMAPTAGNANFITRDERRALDYLNRDRDDGGVLTRFYLGSVIPARTGRRTFVGNCLWSEPGCTPRAQVAQNLFDGTLTPPVARRFVRSTGARFILTDCESRPNLKKMLGSLILSVQRFGCASVYELDAPGRPVGPLAESRLHAAVRAPRGQ
jgi:hypothetical protein